MLAFHLCSQQRMCVVPLPPLEEDPEDEQSKAFQNALSNARVTDEMYLSAMANIDTRPDAGIDQVRRTERELRDRVRSFLGMPRRQTIGDVSLDQHALINGIAPSYDLPIQRMKMKTADIAMEIYNHFYFQTILSIN